MAELDAWFDAACIKHIRFFPRHLDDDGDRDFGFRMVYFLNENQFCQLFCSALAGQRNAEPSNSFHQRGQVNDSDEEEEVTEETKRWNKFQEFVNHFGMDNLINGIGDFYCCIPGARCSRCLEDIDIFL